MELPPVSVLSESTRAAALLSASLLSAYLAQEGRSRAWSPLPSAGTGRDVLWRAMADWVSGRLKSC